MDDAAPQFDHGTFGGNRCESTEKLMKPVNCHISLGGSYKVNNKIVDLDGPTKNKLGYPK